MEAKATRVYFTSMALYWLVFGLITTFYPALMDLFQTEVGVSAKTTFSNHVWMHGGLDIIAFCILLFALSRRPVGPTLLRASGAAALMPTLAIAYSFVATPFWSPLFLVAGAGCLAFAVWGFVLAEKVGHRPEEASAPARI